jgi:predicted ABC-class ATPase
MAMEKFIICMQQSTEKGKGEILQCTKHPYDLKTLDHLSKEIDDKKKIVDLKIINGQMTLDEVLDNDMSAFELILCGLISRYAEKVNHDLPSKIPYKNPEYRIYNIAKRRASNIIKILESESRDIGNGED